mmetsp:Transcript_20049/g.26478  ORF Transcript_20049/g.26478 Transcript_20049/m.26478 type:complete len:98 (+) Transcript_20049:2956-3249(+)
MLMQASGLLDRADAWFKDSLNAQNEPLQSHTLNHDGCATITKTLKHGVGEIYTKAEGFYNSLDEGITNIFISNTADDHITEERADLFVNTNDPEVLP